MNKIDKWLIFVLFLGIENRLLRIEEKTKDDELTLQQLADLVKTISGKFEDIEDILNTLSIPNDCDDVNNVEQLNDESASENVSVMSVSEEVSPLAVSEPMPDGTVSKQMSGGGKEEPNIVEEELQDINIDYSSLPNISKDNRGYKQRCTGRSDDNRRQIRKDRKNKNKNAKTTSERDHEQSVQSRSGASSSNVTVRKKETKEASKSSEQTNSPAKQRKKQQPTTLHQITSPGRPPVVKERYTIFSIAFYITCFLSDTKTFFCAVLNSKQKKYAKIKGEVIR